MKWEYGALDCSLDGKRFSDTSQEFVRFGQRKQKESTGDIGGCQERLALLGEDGWELVGIDRADEHLSFYFKRPLDSSAHDAGEHHARGRRLSPRDMFAVNEGETIIGTKSPGE